MASLFNRNQKRVYFAFAIISCGLNYCFSPRIILLALIRIKLPPSGDPERRLKGSQDRKLGVEETRFADIRLSETNRIYMGILNRKKIDPNNPEFTGKVRPEKISMQLFTYNEHEFIEKPSYALKEVHRIPENDLSYWLNIHGIHDPGKIQRLCEILGIHKITLQDILDINQRPKFQEFEHYWFLTMKSVNPSEASEILTEQLSFVLGKNYLISFQERKGDYFGHIRQRIRENIGLVRQRGTDYLLYLMLESILDNYFKSLDRIEEQVNGIQITELSTDLSPDLLNQIEKYKSEVHLVKKTIIPIKDFISTFEREKFGMIDTRHVKYFFELKDLCLTLIDECEQLELRLESNVNLFFSVQGHKMNEVMKTLTVVSTIFIPLTFLAGIYGMNFSNIPELGWQYGYFVLLFLMLVIAILMLLYFRKKRWF